MSNYISIHPILQHAYGVLAQVTGIPWNVYRPQPNSSGDYIQPQNLIATNVMMDRHPMKSGNPGFEGDKQLPVFWYEIIGNCLPFQVGDIFVSNDQVYNIGVTETNYPSDEFVGMCLAENMPTMQPIMARINTTMQLYTPNLLPNLQDYMDSTLPNMQPIILDNGQFGPANAGQIAANIPIGVVSRRSYGGEIYNQETANMPPVEKRLIFVPALPGYQPKAGDEMVMLDGSRYRIDSNYHQSVGTCGGLYVCGKHITGGGQ
jgi:hypothetical protein